MRVLVLSDIHANLAALEAVLADARQVGYEAVWCLGDTVGYGPEPDECVTRVRLLHPRAVVGNHDWAALERMEVDDFNPEARRAVLWSRRQLRPESLSWLKSLPDRPLVVGDFTLTHGSPRDPVWEYIVYPATAVANFDYFHTPFCLVGHTHLPSLYVRSDEDAAVRAISPAVGETISLKGMGRIILNPGSVGQPRDNDPRAAYAIVDSQQSTWLPRRVSYPIEVTQAHMRAAGLPERLITRLSFGW